MFVVPKVKNERFSSNSRTVRVYVLQFQSTFSETWLRACASATVRIPVITGL